MGQEDYKEHQHQQDNNRYVKRENRDGAVFDRYWRDVLYPL